MLNLHISKHLLARLLLSLIFIGFFWHAFIGNIHAEVTPVEVFGSSTTKLSLTPTYTAEEILGSHCLVGAYGGIAEAVLEIGNSPIITVPYATKDVDTGIDITRNTNGIVKLWCMEQLGIISPTTANEIMTTPSAVDTPYAMLDGFYNNPTASGIIYAQQMFDRATNPGQVFAQPSGFGEASPYFPGLGYEALGAIQTTWGWLVNFVYGIMILVILAIAFAMIFQNALGGKESIQLATAIPNIVIAMVLIPLSYPISGFAIDFLTLGSNAVHGILLSGPNALGARAYQGGAGQVKVNIDLNFQVVDINNLYDFFFPPGEGDPEVFNQAQISFAGGEGSNRGFYIDDPRLSVYRAFTLIDISNMTDFIENNRFEVGLQSEIRNFLERQCISSGGLPGTNDTLVCTINLLALNIGSFFSNSLGYTGIGSVITDIIVLVISYFMFFTGATLFLKLLIKYFNLILLPLVSPIVMASVAIPGTGTKLVMWFIRTLYGSALFFVLTYALIVFIALLSQNGIIVPEEVTLNNQDTFVPPLLGMDSDSNIINNMPINLSTAALLDLAALALFFALPRILARLEEALNIKFKIPDVVKDISAGFQASRGAAGATARTAGAAVRGASSVPRSALRATVRARDQRAPLGQDGYISQRKTEAATRARVNSFKQQSTNPITRTWAQTGGAAITRARNELALAGTGISTSDVKPNFATKLNWSFVSVNNQQSQTSINIRNASLTGTGNKYSNDVEFSIPGEGQNRIYGMGMFSNQGGGTNIINLELRDNPQVKATMRIAGGGSPINFSGNSGTGSPAQYSKPYEIEFHNGAAPGNVFQAVGGAYSFWYRPTPSSPQNEDKRPLTVSIT